MRLAILTLTLMAALGTSNGRAQPARPPIASNPVVTVDGKVQKVQIAMGQGMPYIEVLKGEQTLKVYLGPVRFLMEQNFNPKAGAEVSVKGYQMNSDVVAISVTIPSEKRTIKLRDAEGFPVWRGGMMGGRMRK